MHTWKQEKRMHSFRNKNGQASLERARPGECTPEARKNLRALGFLIVT
jgi:hypothetical protein